MTGRSSRELDALLADNDAVATELAEMVRARQVAGRGADAGRDVILPGELEDLMNKFAEAARKRPPCAATVS